MYLLTCTPFIVAAAHHHIILLYMRGSRHNIYAYMACIWIRGDRYKNNERQTHDMVGGGVWLPKTFQIFNYAYTYIYHPLFQPRAVPLASPTIPNFRSEKLRFKTRYLCILVTESRQYDDAEHKQKDNNAAATTTIACRDWGKRARESIEILQLFKYVYIACRMQGWRSTEDGVSRWTYSGLMMNCPD